MELWQAIRDRRSIRKYTSELVDQETIYKIIEAGIWAPSACNIQGWKYIVLDSPEVIKTIYKSGGASFLQNVKQAIVVLYENQTDNVEYQDHIQSAAASIQNMLLMAHSLKVGTCWVNNIPNKRILRKILNIPFSYDPIALITIGYYDYIPNDRKRKYSVQELISYNKFDFDIVSSKSRIKVAIKRFCRKIYKILPGKVALLKIVGRFEKKFDN